MSIAELNPDTFLSGPRFVEAKDDVGELVREKRHANSYLVSSTALTMHVSNALIQETAILAREAWMRQMGLPDDEVKENCDIDRYPVNLKDELESLVAILRLHAKT